MPKYSNFLLFSFLVCCIFHLGCKQKEAPILIAVASNMQFAMEEILAAFEKQSGHKGELVISSSGKLTAQILQGAPYDVFISADLKYPKKIESANLGLEPSKVLAYGKLVLWSMDERNPPRMSDMKQESIQHIALANPETAPYGQAAKQLLESLNMYETLGPKLVFGESISQVNQFLLSKSVQLGFTAKSVVLSPKMKGQGSWTEMSSEHFEAIEQGALILKNDGKPRDKALEFYTFLFSKEARQILSDFGYDLP